MAIVTNKTDIYDWIKDIHDFHLSVADVNAWEANGE